MLQNPLLKMAFQTLMVTAMPSAAPVTTLVPGVSAEAMALVDSNRYHHRSGFTAFYKALHNLARLADVKKQGAEWGDLLETGDE